MLVIVMTFITIIPIITRITIYYYHSDSDIRIVECLGESDLSHSREMRVPVPVAPHMKVFRPKPSAVA